VAAQIAAGELGQGNVAALAGKRRGLLRCAQPLAWMGEQMLAARNRAENGQATIGGGEEQVDHCLPFSLDSLLLEPLANPAAAQRAILYKPGSTDGLGLRGAETTNRVPF
jgi:hypothetical protein